MKLGLMILLTITAFLQTAPTSLPEGLRAFAESSAWRCTVDCPVCGGFETCDIGRPPQTGQSTVHDFAKALPEGLPRVRYHLTARPEVTFSAPCGFILRLDQGKVTVAEADREVTMQFQGKRMKLAAHTLVTVAK